MAITKDQILSAKPKTHAVEVPEWGGTARIRPLSVAALGRFLEAKEKLDGSGQLALLVALSLCDEAGSLLFEEGDSGSLAGQPFEVINRISDEVMKLNKLSKAEGDAKNA